jgi:hypothetical protein
MGVAPALRRPRPGHCRIEVQLDRWGAEQPPKSKAGVREIRLSCELVNALKVWRLQSLHRPEDAVFLRSTAGGSSTVT